MTFRPLHPKAIFIGLIAGLAVGWVANATGVFQAWPFFYEIVNLGGDLFKQLILMVVIPLVIVSLIGGMMSLGEVKALGRIGLKTTLLYAFTAFAACAIALVLAGTFKPGEFVSAEKRDALAQQYAQKQQDLISPLQGENAQKNEPSLWRFIRSLVPANIFDSLAKGQMLPIIFFSLFFGLTAATLPAERRNFLHDFFAAMQAVTIRMVEFVMYAAPLGVFCLLTIAVADLGASVFSAMAAYCAVLVAGLLLQALVVYGGIVRLFTKISLRDFYRACKPALITAFGTSSSAASLAVNMTCVGKRLNVSNGITSFVLPVGTTVNLDGTAIMQTVATLFLAQLYGIPLSFEAQAFVIFTAMLAAVGTAPVPSAGIAMLVIILEPLGIPLEGIALIWAVDRPLDMLRTVINVLGDAVAAAVVAASEGEDVRYIDQCID